jgi:hypothetical protein
MVAMSPMRNWCDDQTWIITPVRHSTDHLLVPRAHHTVCSLAQRGPSLIRYPSAKAATTALAPFASGFAAIDFARRCQQA